MRIIDRYLLSQFVKVYLVCFLSLAGLYVVFDAFANLDEFMDHADSSTEMLGMMGSFYAHRTVWLFERIAGSVALIAAMFTLTWIQGNNELVALLAAGIPTRRVLLPVILACVTLALMATGVRECVMPLLQEELQKTPRDLLGQYAHAVPPRYDRRTNILLQGKSGFAADRRIDKPNFYLPPQITGVRTVLRADTAFYQEATADHPAGYLFDQVLEPVSLLRGPSLGLTFASGESETVIYSPADTYWLKENQCFVVCGIAFEQLIGGENYRQFSSTADLIRGLHNPSLDYGGSMRVAVHGRLLQPFMDLTLLLLGIPFAMTGRNRNVFIAIGVCMIVIVAFWITTIACQWLGSTSILSPAFSAWLPLIVFVPAAVWLLWDLMR